MKYLIELAKNYFIFVLLYLFSVVMGAVLIFFVAPEFGVAFAVIGYVVPHIVGIMVVGIIANCERENIIKS